eukprot:scaffold6315_cov116-Cylindrotheca_fusiformis.AAC.8
MQYLACNSDEHRACNSDEIKDHMNNQAGGHRCLGPQQRAHTEIPSRGSETDEVCKLKNQNNSVPLRKLDGNKKVRHYGRYC